MVTLQELQSIALDDATTLPCLIKEFGTFNLSTEGRMRAVIGYIGMCLGYNRDSVNFVRVSDGSKIFYVCTEMDRTIAYHPAIEFMVDDMKVIYEKVNGTTHKCPGCDTHVPHANEYCENCEVPRCVDCDELLPVGSSDETCSTCYDIRNDIGNEESEDENEESIETTTEGNE